jgi:uncharacterized protein YyaL (SSP411 family)
MEAVQALSGSGGWPMTVFLDTEGRPFYGGTYFPPSRFVELLRAVAGAWQERRSELTDQAEELTEVIRRSAAVGGGGAPPGARVLDEAVEALVGAVDPSWGGFGRAPKFPQSMSLDLLLRRGVVDPVVRSLDAMASGGIYDHLGGGFARYSLDDRWLVPHFEKMLYDQALLARVYLHAWQATGLVRFRQVLEESIAYVLRDLAAPGGGWCSAEDADAEGVEGKFYVWSLEEVLEVGGPVAVDWYGVTAGGNFEGANILTRPVRGDLVRPPEVEAARAALFERREGRVRPGLDDKVLTEWNALFLSVLAEAAAATRRLDWAEAAVANGEFLLRELRRPDGRWLRSWQRDAGAKHLAYAADHAALVDAAEATRALRVGGQVGLRLPAHATSGGLAMLAGLPPEQLARLYPDETLSASPDGSQMTRTELEVALAEVRQSGYAVAYNESDVEIGAVGVSIPEGPDHVHAALAIAAPASRLTPERIEQWARAAHDTAQRIGMR